MFRILFFIICALIPFNLSAQHFTIRALAGHNTVKLKSHPIVDSNIAGGQAIGLGFGYQFSEMLRAELETAYRTNFVNSFTIKGPEGQFEVPVNGKLESCSILGNAIFTLPIRYYVQPYIGLGMGTTAEYANWSTAIIEDNIWYDFQEGKRLGMSYQVIIGAHLPAYENIYCGIEYRMLDSILDHMCCLNRTFIFTVHKQF